MELRVDRDRCISAGMCALTAPGIFDQDLADGRVLLERTPGAEDEAQVREAVLVCPSGALTIAG
ncbi:ferredoxin [Nocardia sp. NPDC048505]|uniref:ferredoxin n=1 Tax=unclassified Nocardia TaxID=2637762 RepID=UPI0033D6EA65